MFELHALQAGQGALQHAPPESGGEGGHRTKGQAHVGKRARQLGGQQQADVLPEGIAVLEVDAHLA